MSKIWYDFRRMHAAALLQDLHRRGWRIAIGPTGRPRFERRRRNAPPLRWELRYWLIKEYRNEVMRILYRERKAADS